MVSFIFPSSCLSCSYSTLFYHMILLPQTEENLSLCLITVNTTPWTYIGEVKCTHVQALRLCTGRKAHRGTTALEGGERSGSHPAILYPQERPSTHCTGGWVGPRASLDRCGKSRSHWDSILGPSSPQPVAIPTELPGPHIYIYEGTYFQALLTYNSKR